MILQRGISWGGGSQQFSDPAFMKAYMAELGLEMPPAMGGQQQGKSIGNRAKQLGNQKGGAASAYTHGVGPTSGRGGGKGDGRGAFPFVAAGLGLLGLASRPKAPKMPQVPEYFRAGLEAQAPAFEQYQQAGLMGQQTPAMQNQYMQGIQAIARQQQAAGGQLQQALGARGLTQSGAMERGLTGIARGGVEARGGLYSDMLQQMAARQDLAGQSYLSQMGIMMGQAPLQLQAEQMYNQQQQQWLQGIGGFASAYMQYQNQPTFDPYMYAGMLPQMRQQPSQPYTPRPR